MELAKDEIKQPRVGCSQRIWLSFLGTTGFSAGPQRTGGHRGGVRGVLEGPGLSHTRPEGLLVARKQAHCSPLSFPPRSAPPRVLPAALALLSPTPGAALDVRAQRCAVSLFLPTLPDGHHSHRTRRKRGSVVPSYPHTPLSFGGYVPRPRGCLKAG